MKTNVREDKKIVAITLSPLKHKIKFIHFDNKKGESVLCFSIPDDLYFNIIAKSITLEKDLGYLTLKGGKDND